MTEVDSTWTDLRVGWADANEKERAERESWVVPLMHNVSRSLESMKEDGWHRVGMGGPSLNERVLGWTPGALPCRMYRDNKSWWAICDGDLWPTDPPLMWKAL